MTNEPSEHADRMHIFMRVCAGLLTHVGVPECTNIDAVLRAARVQQGVPAGARRAVDTGYEAGRQADSVIPFAQQSYMQEEAGHEQQVPPAHARVPAGDALPKDVAGGPAALRGHGMNLPPDAMNSELIMDASSDGEDEAAPITYMRMRDYVAALLRDDLLC